LKAQLLYSTEKYSESVQVYETIQQKFGVTNDLITNLCAALVLSGDKEKVTMLTKKYQNELKDTFEFSYNSACAFIKHGDFANAQKYLELAQSSCKANLTTEGFSKEDIEDEIAIIKAQTAYVLQRMDKNQMALQNYKELEKTKISDLSVVAVIDNNITTLQNIGADSLKKLIKIRGDNFQIKLLNIQKQIVASNYELILQKVIKTDECKDIVSKLQSELQVSDHGTKSMTKEGEVYNSVLKKNADGKFSAGQYKEAASIYKQLLNINPNDLEVLPLLVMAYTYFDPEKARDLESRIPDLQNTEIDPEELENIVVPTVKREISRKAESLNTSQRPKTKKKKKRKNKLPKTMDPNKPPDPERWLPRHERSNFKGRRKGKGKDRGAQGAISASHAVKTQEARSKNIDTLEEGKVHNIDKEEQKEFENNKPATSAPTAARRGGRTTQHGRGGPRGGRGQKRKK